MKNSFYRFLIRLFPIALLVAVISSCAGNGKSELVRRLEAIFYDPSFAEIPDTLFNVADFGAVGDGKILDTKAIQDCIDAAFSAGGGVVSFPEGIFLSGSFCEVQCRTSH